jgi:uncharacterized protein YbjT (DUF2867 family)
MAQRTAVILGATGLIGGHCLEILLRGEFYAGVTTLGRRAAPAEHPKLSQRVVDLAQPESFAHLLAPHTDVFCCLGTTIKTAGSEAAFRRVDYEYPLNVARVAAQRDDTHFLLVSSLGADAASRLFYSRVKGEAEAAISALPFAGVHIFRPSLLLGERAEFRFGERVAELAAAPLSLLMLGPLRKYRPIHARTVAQAMTRTARAARAGMEILESGQIAEIGN